MSAFQGDTFQIGFSITVEAYIMRKDDIEGWRNGET